MTFSHFKCRCSAIVKMMASSRSNPQLTDLQAKKLAELEGKDTLTVKQQEELAALLIKKENGNKVILSDTCIEYLMEWYAFDQYGMIPMNKETLELLQIKKGKMAEIQAGNLLMIVDNEIYEQHKERIENDYLSGEVDYYFGRSIMEAEKIFDIKNSFDYPTFLKKINNGLENGQKEQVQGYCDITGAREGYIVNCLVDNPDEIIEEMRWKLAKRLNAVTVESPDFIKEWEVWERSMRFSQIPHNLRVNKIPVQPFTDFERQKVYDRVKICREYLAQFHETYSQFNNSLPLPVNAEAETGNT